MKKCLALFVLALSSAVGLAAPRRAVLVVQNHCSGDVQPPMSALADTLVARLSGDDFRVVNPHNVIGVQQNRTAAGEAMPEMSALALAQSQRADGILTASVQEFTSESLGVPPVGYRMKARLSLSLADAASGETVCGVSNVAFGKNYTADQVKEDGVSLFESHLHAAAERCAAQFLSKAKATAWEPAAAGKVTVFFGCNVLGADIQIDGMSYGTCPAEIKVAPGVHNLVVSYSSATDSWFHPYSRRAMFQTDGQQFAIVLQPTEAGERSRRSGELFDRQKVLFDAELARYKDAGKVEDYVRKTIADGVSLYWKNSCGRIVITDGKADKVELTTPVTDSGTLQEGPSSSEIGAKLHKLLEGK